MSWRQEEQPYYNNQKGGHRRTPHAMGAAKYDVHHRHERRAVHDRQNGNCLKLADYIPRSEL